MTKGTLRPQISLADARHAIARYSLPLADYRDYLSLVIETCFWIPDDYLQHGGRSPQWYPGCFPPPIPEAGPPARTFEVRRTGAVDLEPHLVAIVPDETAFVDCPGTLRKLRKHAAKLRVKWFPPRQGELPHVAASRFVAEFLREWGIG